MDVEPSSRKVAILYKGDKFGILSLQVESGGTILSLTDANGDVRVSPCQTPSIGRERFDSSLATSVGNGYRVGYVGAPLEG